MAAIKFDITADGSQVKREVREVNRSLGKMNHEAEQAGISMKEMFKQAMLFSGAALGAAGLKEFGAQIVNVRKEMQRFQISFNTLLGSRQKAEEMFGELKQFAATTPLMLNDLASGAQTMLGFNIAAEQVVPTLKAIGDISMGDAQRFQSLTLAFSQMSATGKLMGQDLLQMINAGFNPLAQISKTTGKSISDLKEEMSQGAISAEMVAKAFMDATSEGGQFYGMLEKQGKGLAGQFNQLQGAINDMFNELGEKSESVIVKAVGGVTELVKHYEDVGRVLLGVISTYGAYKAAVMGLVAVQSLEAAGAVAAAGAHGVQAVAMGLAQKAAALLNATLLANPFVLCTTLLVGLVSAAWAFRDATSAGEKGAKAYNDTLEERVRQEQSLKAAMQENLTILQDMNESDAKRQRALDALKEQYPELFRNYDIETIKLADIVRLKQQMAELDAQRAGAKVEEDLDDIEKQIKRLEALVKSMGSGDEGYIQKLNELRGQRAQAMREYSKTLSEEYAKGLANVDGATLDRYITELERRIKGKASEEELDLKLPGADGRLGRAGRFSVKEVQSLIDLTRTKKGGAGGSGEQTPYQKQARKMYEDWKKAKTEYDRLLKDADATKEDVDKAYSEMERLDKAYADLTHGDKASAVAKAGTKKAEQVRSQEESLAELEEKLGRERARAELDREFEKEQAVIDSLKEGGEKTRRQLELNHRQELETIRREQEDLKAKREEEARALWEARNPEGSWSGSGEQAKFRAQQTLSSEDEELFARKMEAATAAYNEGISALLEKERQHMREYLEEYGSFEEQKLAVTQEYDEKISKAEDEWQRRTLQKQKEEALKQLDTKGMMEKIQGNPDYIEAMIDPSRLGTDALEDLNDMLEEAKMELSNLPPDQLQAISDLMNDINDEIVERNPFAAIAEGLRDLADARGRVKEAKEEMLQANKAYKAAVDAGAPSDEVAEAKQKAADATNRYTNALNDEQSAETKVEKGKQKASDAISSLTSSISDLAGTMDQVGGKTSEVISSVGSLVNFIGLAMKTTSIEFTTAIKAIESASVILAVISAAFQVVMKVSSLFNDDERIEKGYENAKKEYDNLVSTWDTLIRRKREYMDISWGEDASKAGREAANIVENQIEAARGMAMERVNTLRAQSSHERTPYDVFESIGIDGWDDLISMSAEGLKGVQENYALFWAQMDDDLRGYLEAVIAGAETLEDLEEGIKEKFTSMTFDDMYTSFVNTLMDMDASSADFADNVSEYFMRAILNNQIGAKYQEKLQEWYDDMADAIEAGGGTLTDAEMEDLQNRYQAIVQDAVDMRDTIAEATGYDTTSAARGSSGVSSSVTQDSIDEANGRMAALQMGQQTMIMQGIQLIQGSSVSSGHLNTLVEMASLRNIVLNDIYERIGSLQSAFQAQLMAINDNTKNI